ncbi:MAG TPA: hypothetical protein VMW52_12500 [Phycisphaerae bacterium]|nr:hypothetical protein [Phycisphaerae bacterium]
MPPPNNENDTINLALLVFMAVVVILLLMLAGCTGPIAGAGAGEGRTVVYFDQAGRAYLIRLRTIAGPPLRVPVLDRTPGPGLWTPPPRSASDKQPAPKPAQPDEDDEHTKNAE